MTNMTSIIFIILAILNIALLIIKWIKTDEDEVNAISGWTCAILYCVLYNL